MKKALVIASIVVLVALAAAAQKRPRMAESFIEAWNSHEVEKVISLFTNDVMYEDVTFGAGLSLYDSAHNSNLKERSTRCLVVGYEVVKKSQQESLQQFQQFAN